MSINVDLHYNLHKTLKLHWLYIQWFNEFIFCYCASREFPVFHCNVRSLMECLIHTSWCVSPNATLKISGSRIAWPKERNIFQAFDTHGQMVSQRSYTYLCFYQPPWEWSFPHIHTPAGFYHSFKSLFASLTPALKCLLPLPVQLLCQIPAWPLKSCFGD